MTVGGVDPVLFGDQTLESSQVTSPSGSASAFPFSSQLTGDAMSFDVYVDSGSSATKLVVGLYSDKRGHPGSLLAGSSMLLPGGGVWNPLTFNSTPVYAGRNYWIAILGTGGKLAYRAQADGPCTSAVSSKSTLTSLPSSWSTGSQSHNCPASVYVNGFEAPPWNTVLPAISGTTVQGQTLTASPGSWGNAPISFAYQWQRCGGSGCSNIPGAVGSTYVLQSSDVSDTTDVVVTAAGEGGSASAASAQSGTVAPIGSSTGSLPINTAIPTIIGTATQGNTLTAAPGGWTNSPSSFAYQWQDCTSSGCSDIAGATSPGYTLQSGDIGDAVDVVVTASNSFGSGSASSAPSATVTESSTSAAIPTDTSPPVVSGVTIQGHVLTASTGTWANSATSFSYQWEDCNGAGAACSSIAGATSSSYVLAASDAFHTIRVAVTASNGAGSSAPAVSVGSGAPSFNAAGATTMVLASPTPTWTATYDGSPGSWGISSNGCDDLLNDPSYTGWWGFDGNASGSGGDGYIGKFGWNGGFPSGSSTPYFGFTTGQTASSPAFAGQAAQLSVDHSATTPGEVGQRSDLYQCPVDPAATIPVSDSSSGAYEGADRWYRLEVYFPSNYQAEPNTSFNWVAEFHNYPDDGTCCANISAGIVTDSEDGGAASSTGRFSWRILGGGCPTATSGCAGPIPPGTNMNAAGTAGTYGGAVKWFAGPALQLNHWYDVLMHVHWAYQASQGSVQLWLDGAQEINYTGPTLYYLQSTSGSVSNFAGPGDDYLMVDNYRWGERTTGSNSCSSSNCDTVATAIDHDEDMWGATESSVGGGP